MPVTAVVGRRRTTPVEKRTGETSLTPSTAATRVGRLLRDRREAVLVLHDQRGRDLVVDRLVDRAADAGGEHRDEHDEREADHQRRRGHRGALRLADRVLARELARQAARPSARPARAPAAAPAAAPGTRRRTSSAPRPGRAARRPPTSSRCRRRARRTAPAGRCPSARASRRCRRRRRWPTPGVTRRASPSPARRGSRGGPGTKPETIVATTPMTRPMMTVPGEITRPGRAEVDPERLQHRRQRGRERRCRRARRARDASTPTANVSISTERSTCAARGAEHPQQRELLRALRHGHRERVEDQEAADEQRDAGEHQQRGAHEAERVGEVLRLLLGRLLARAHEEVAPELRWQRRLDRRPGRCRRSRPRSSRSRRGRSCAAPRAASSPTSRAPPRLSLPPSDAMPETLNCLAGASPETVTVSPTLKSYFFAVPRSSATSSSVCRRAAALVVEDLEDLLGR